MFRSGDFGLSKRHWHWLPQSYSKTIVTSWLDGLKTSGTAVLVTKSRLVSVWMYSETNNKRTVPCNSTPAVLVRSSDSCWQTRRTTSSAISSSSLILYFATAVVAVVYLQVTVTERTWSSKPPHYWMHCSTKARSITGRRRTRIPKRGRGHRIHSNPRKRATTHDTTVPSIKQASKHLIISFAP